MMIKKRNNVSEVTSRALCTGAAVLVLSYVAVGTTAAETAQGVHEHGAAEVELALEGSDVLVNFASPLYNLVGFEHAPRDDRDREAVAATLALLDDPGNLVLLQADAACTVVELDIEWEMASTEEEEHEHDEASEHDAHGDHDAGDHDAHDAHEEDDHDAHDAHEADEHDAHETHDADEHHAHDADDHDEHDGEEGHADASVAIRYHCDNPDRLNALDITAFESFERLSEVEVRAVGPGGAVAESVERASPRADLRGLFGR